MGKIVQASEATSNDGVDNSTGETQFLNLGKVLD